MAERLGSGEPSREDQERFWNQWNAENRGAENLDDYQRRLRQYAASTVSRAPQPRRILEIGCGTGWLSQALIPFGDVTGVDLSSAAVELAKKRCPQARFFAGDFLSLQLSGRYNFVVTADTLAHVADQPGFIANVAKLLEPRGLLLLMSQNPFVWRRSTYVQPLAPGQIRRWPELSELRAMLAPHFDVLNVTSLAPGGGNVGIMKAANSRYGWGLLRRVLGPGATAALYERLRLGRELAVLAARK